MTGVAPEGEQMPSCMVDSPDQCPAARRAQIQVFSDSDDLDACPKLRNRPQGQLSALCVPVSVMGRAVGVIHATGKPEDDVEENQIQDLSTLAKLAGARIGLLRVMAETQLQASTDTLTGLLNRRSFSELVGQVPPRQHPMAIVMADLDHFKVLNDTYGHDTGDRALRLFARVLRDTLRTSDLVCRYGGEEFAVAFPDCAAADAMHAIDSMRVQLDAAITVAGLPKFTSSFGVTDKEPGSSSSQRSGGPTTRSCPPSAMVGTRSSTTTPASPRPSGQVTPGSEADRIADQWSRRQRRPPAERQQPCAAHRGGRITGARRRVG